MKTAQLQLLEPKSAIHTISFASHQIAESLGQSSDVLRSIFPTPEEETRLQKARRVMGEAVASLPDEELETYLTEFNFLLDSWLDQYEKQLFDGKTLNQLLREA